jgi:aminoglycoside phosphotransferase (APT) family kinase protein
VPAACPVHPAGPDSDTLVEAYGRRTGRDLSELPWYLGFAFYKIAAIFEGIHYRTQQRLTVGEGFEGLGDMVPALTERGHAALGGWSWPYRDGAGRSAGP